MGKHQQVKPGQYVRAMRNGRNDHGFKSGQVVRVVNVDGDEVYAEGEIMRWASGSSQMGSRCDWGGGRGGMYLYPDEYKLAKQRNRKEGV